MGKHYDRNGDGIADRDDDAVRPAVRAQPRASVSAASVLTSFGLVNVDALIQAASLERMDIAAAAACIQKESGGRNVWGSDPVSTGGAYVKGSPVTESAYKAYRALVQAGRIGRQGVGPCQCTSAGYQDTADALGGAWLPVANMRSGFRGLQALIARYGVQGGAQRYNGAGAAAVAYGLDFSARYQVWAKRLAGAAITPTATAKRKALIDMPERAVPAGNSGGRIVCPTGAASSMVSQSWFSASFDGIATVEVWAQKSGGGNNPIGSAPEAGAYRKWNVLAGDRPFFELPSGTEFVTYHVTNASGPGGVCIEQLPK